MAASHQTHYVPGMYAKKRTSMEKLVDRCIQEYEIKRKADEEKKPAKKAKPHYHYICFSRKIGVGALEIADIIGKKIGYKVIDRQVMEYIAGEKLLKTGTLSGFDEKYSGMVSEFASLLFGEKSFTMGDYLRNVVDSVLKIAETGPTIFVGRATHLILPRQDVLAVRIISSREHRIKRLAEILNVSERQAANEIDEQDKMQRDFFKKNFKKKDASPYEFDMVINRDYITSAKDAAELVRMAFAMKFGDIPVQG